MFWVPQSGGVGLGVSILSYAGWVRLGVLVDEGLVPDPEAIVAAFHAEFDALLELARETKEKPSVADLVAMLDDALATLDVLLERGAVEPASEPGEAPARCQALTTAGRPCRNRALPGSHFCHMHA